MNTTDKFNELEKLFKNKFVLVTSASQDITHDMGICKEVIPAENGFKIVLDGGMSYRLNPEIITETSVEQKNYLKIEILINSTFEKISEIYEFSIPKNLVTALATICKDMGLTSYLPTRSLGGQKFDSTDLVAVQVKIPTNIKFSKFQFALATILNAKV